MPVYVRHITRVPVCVVQIRIRFVVQIRGTIQKWKHFPGHLSWLLTFTYRSLYIEQKTKKKKTRIQRNRHKLILIKRLKVGGKLLGDLRLPQHPETSHIPNTKSQFQIPNPRSPRKLPRQIDILSRVRWLLKAFSQMLLIDVGHWPSTN